MWKLLPIFAVLLAPTGGVADEPATDDAERAYACITVRSYNQMFYQAITDYEMYVKSGNDHYLVEFRRRCASISDGYNIRFDTRSTRVCPSTRGGVDYYFQNIEMPTCPVDTIREVNGIQDAMAIVSEKDQVRKNASAKKREERLERRRAKREAKREKEKAKEAAKKAKEEAKEAARLAKEEEKEAARKAKEEKQTMAEAEEEDTGG
ncbi:MAG: DUF6491 family protein [Pseudomonadota bacterium]